MRDVLSYLGDLTLIAVSLEVEDKVRKVGQRVVTWEGLDPPLLALKTEEEGYEPTNVVASRNWQQSSADSQKKMGLRSYNPKELNSANKLNGREMDSRASRKECSPPTPWF